MKIEDNRLASEDILLKEIETMNTFGGRTTGSNGHREYIEWLKKQLEDMALEVHSDTHTFNRWEEKKSALLINEEEIHIASAYPYSGETDENGITGELIPVKSGNYNKAEGKIAVVEINTIKSVKQAG